MSFIFSVTVVQYLGLKAYAAVLWLPILVLCLAFVLPLTASWISPLKVETERSAKSSNSYKQNLRLFITFWVGFILFAVVYGFSMGWLASLMGGTRQDVELVTGMWSMPLGLINPAFLIKPEKSLAEVLGILTASCYFYALALTFVFKVVHGFLRRNRVTQLGISGTTIDDDDDL